MSAPQVTGSTYERLRVIGRGGMGEVFLARQRGVEGFERPVALKRILPGLKLDPELRRRFVTEARIMGSLNHPNICQTIDLCSVEGDLFLVLELLEGVTLNELVTEVGQLPSAVVGGLLLQVCAGLEHAHARGLVHRDLCPWNLFVTTSGQLKILDFGLAKVIGSSHSSSGRVGKSPYMSPEQVDGRPLDERSDLFSLAVVGLEALTGSPVFLRDSDYLTYRAILEDTRPVGLTTSPLEPALARCLEVDRAMRPASTRELARLLQEALRPHGGETSQLDLSDFVEHHMAAVLRDNRSIVSEALAEETSADTVILHTVELAGAPTARPPIAPGPGAPPAPEPGAAPAPSRRTWLVAALILVGLAVAVVAVAARGGQDEEPAAAAAPLDAVPVAPPPFTATPTPLAPDAAPIAPPPDAGVLASARPDERDHVSAPRPRRPGFVSIDATPFATIHIDGVDVGTTPVVEHPLPAGSHSVVAITRDGRRKRFTMRVRPGKITVERIAFD